jgi:hypothetical protein
MASSTHVTAEVRRLWPADMPLFRDHLLRLDSRSRHERFSGGMSDDFLIRYAQNCFGEGDLVFGAFIDGVMRGAAELRSALKSRFAAAASAKRCSAASRRPRATTASRRSRSFAPPTTCR